MPEARAHHAAAVFGAGLFVHGGLTGDGRTLSDWNVFDFGLQVWIRCQVDEIDPDFEDERPKGEPPLANYTRKNHTLTPVVETTLTDGRELTRLQWSTQLQDAVKKVTLPTPEQGMFMFGGADAEGRAKDDLYWVTPDTKFNARLIAARTGDWTGKLRPELKLQAKRVKTEGRGPLPRYSHAATFFRNQLVIHGGRNDAIFPAIKNVALNDLHVLDVATKRWCTLALYGESIPESRWGHCIVANDSKIMIFGGMNLTSYCESILYDIFIGK